MELSRYVQYKSYFLKHLNYKWPKLFNLVEKYKTGIKYIISGGIAALINLVLLYFFTEALQIWYLISSVIAYCFALIVSFVLQKYWTFRDNNLKRIKKQTFIYLLIGISDFFLVPLLLYILVEKFHIWYMWADILVLGATAIVAYLVNKFITFKKEDVYEGINDKS